MTPGTLEPLSHAERMNHFGVAANLVGKCRALFTSLEDTMRENSRLALRQKCSQNDQCRAYHGNKSNCGVEEKKYEHKDRQPWHIEKGRWTHPRQERADQLQVPQRLQRHRRDRSA